MTNEPETPDVEEEDEPFTEEDEHDEPEVQDEPREYRPIPLPDIGPLYDADRPTVKVRLDREGYAVVNGVRRYYSRSNAGALVNVRVPEG